MADPNTRQGKRTPVTLKIKFKSETLEQFIERYAVDVSQGGIFIRTKEPLAVGTQMKFEFQLRDASPLISGEGTVVWTRENDPSRPAIAPGMGVRFDRLAEGSQSVLERILAEKAKQAPQRSAAESTRPPMFTDTPTRVAPAPVQEALLTPNKRARSDSEQTPLPKPMPFHSDADEFPEEAFEEATKVRSLDELVAQTAAIESATATTTALPSEELAAHRQQGRADSTLADPPQPEERKPAEIDRESAPGLPSPPDVDPAAMRPGKLLDTTPSPRATRPSEPPATRAPEPTKPLPAAADLAGRTRLGVEPAKASTTARPAPAERVAVPRPVTGESSLPVAPKRPSSAPIVIGILLVVAAALAGVWWFVLRPELASNTTLAGAGGSAGSGSAMLASGSAGSGSAAELAGSGSAELAAGSGSAMGSGSATEMAGSGSGSATELAGSGSAAPTGPIEKTVITANVPKATVEVEGSAQTGKAPFTAQLVKDQPYKVRVSAPGYAALELDVTGGKPRVVAKLVAKPRVVSVTSDPPGAMIYIDGTNSGKVTPSEVQLTASQASRSRVHVTLRKAGYRTHDQVVAKAGFTDDDARMLAKVDVKLPVAVYHPHHPANTGAGSAHESVGSAAGSGSASPEDTHAGSAATGSSGAGEGSASGESGGETHPGAAGSGASAPGATGAGAGSATKPPAATPPAAGSAAPPTIPPAAGSGS